MSCLRFYSLRYFCLNSPSGSPLPSTERHLLQRGEPAQRSGLGTSAQGWIHRIYINNKTGRKS